jgi:hypothetical protein
MLAEAESAMLVRDNRKAAELLSELRARCDEMVANLALKGPGWSQLTGGPPLKHGLLG